MEQSLAQQRLERQRASDRKSYHKRRDRLLVQRRAAYKTDPQRYRDYANNYNTRVRKNPEKWAAAKLRTKNYHRRRKGIPLAPYAEPQFCELCGSAQEYRALAIDHDHVSGQFRGWLCTKCNTGLGLLGGNESGILRVLDYLRRKI